MGESRVYAYDTRFLRKQYIIEVIPDVLTPDWPTR